MASISKVPLECFIADESRFWNSGKDIIRVSVCRDLPVIYEHDGNAYCVLHYPDSKKHEYTDFLYVLSERLTEEKLDFSYVYFPTTFYLHNIQCKEDARFWSAVFAEHANFQHAIFSKEVDFRRAVFHRGATFQDAVFEDNAIFSLATFKEETRFYSAKFDAHADFDSAAFEKDVGFWSVNFGQYCKFQNVSFKGNAEFTGASFEHLAVFDRANFEGEAAFGRVRFVKDARFLRSRFSGQGQFHGAQFEDNAYFQAAIFEDGSDLTFEKAVFSRGAKFDRAIIRGYITFAGAKGKRIFEGSEAFLSLDEAHLEKPHKLTFHGVILYPRWFKNIDSREITFIDVTWGNVDSNYTARNVKNELIKLESTENATVLLKTSLRQLGENAEKNNRFEEASNFRRLAMETEWLERKRELNDRIKKEFPKDIDQSQFGEFIKKVFFDSVWVLRRNADFVIHGLYRLSSFYGESWAWATLMLLSLVLLVFPFIYTTRLFHVCPSDRPISVSMQEGGCAQKRLEIFDGSAVLQSLTTATFQNTEHRRPVTVWGEFWIIVEKILVPLQFALVALALRRKFMR